MDRKKIKNVTENNYLWSENGTAVVLVRRLPTKWEFASLIYM